MKMGIKYILQYLQRRRAMNALKYNARARVRNYGTKRTTKDIKDVA